MRRASILAQRRFTSRYRRIVMKSRRAGSAASPLTCMHLPIGSVGVGFGAWRWNRQASTGFRCFRSWRSAGSKFILVNAHYLKSVPGRKSDVSDCEWIQYLHSVGLLRASFRPPEAICAIRTLWRHRGSLLEMHVSWQECRRTADVSRIAFTQSKHRSSARA